MPPRPLLCRPSLAPAARAAGSGRCRARAGARPLPPGSAAPSPRSARSGESRPSPPSLPGARRGRCVRGGRAGGGCGSRGWGRGGGRGGSCGDGGRGSRPRSGTGVAAGRGARARCGGALAGGSCRLGQPPVVGGRDHRRLFPPLSPSRPSPDLPPRTRRSQRRRLVAAGLRCGASLGSFDLKPPAASSCQMSLSLSPLGSQPRSRT